jgi:hypothetical protein
MLHVDIPTQSEIKDLAQTRSTICASFYLPTSTLSHEADHDRLALKNLASDAIGRWRPRATTSGRSRRLPSRSTI